MTLNRFRPSGTPDGASRAEDGKSPVPEGLQSPVARGPGQGLISTILRLPAVKVETGYSRSTIYLRVSQRLLPRPVRLGLRSVGWPYQEIAAINSARIAGKTDNEIRDLVATLESARRGCLPCL